jgi:hypothetical protein
MKQRASVADPLSAAARVWRWSAASGQGPEPRRSVGTWNLESGRVGSAVLGHRAAQHRHHVSWRRFFSRCVCDTRNLRERRLDSLHVAS